MSFGNRRLDEALDRHLTQTPEEYFNLVECEICGNWIERDEKHKCEEQDDKTI